MNRYILILIFTCILLLQGCTQASHDSNMITVWHWMTDRHDSFLELAAQYHQKTGMKVNIQLFAPSDVYSQKITAAAQAEILPDIFGVLDEKLGLSEFIKSDMILNLKEEFEANGGEWRQRFFEKALAVNIFEEGNFFGVDDGIYGVPLDITTIQFVYNKDLLHKAGYDRLPETFDDFVAMAEGLRALEVSPFVSGWSEQWLAGCFASNYAFNIMGQDKVMATYRGEVLYTDPDWIRVFSIFKTLVDERVIDSSIVIKANKFAEQDFALGRAAFAFNGSWAVNVYHGMNPNLNYGVMMPPPISDKYPLLIWGGAGSSLVVNKRAPNRDKAIAFLKWLTEKEQQQYLSERTQNLPSNRYALAELPERLVDFGTAIDQSTHPKVWPVEEDLFVKQKFEKSLQSIIIGELTPQEAAREVQEMKDRQVKRAAKRRY